MIAFNGGVAPNNHPDARPIGPPGPDDRNPIARPIIPTTRPPPNEGDADWEHPGGGSNRPPPAWGPPIAPGSTFLLLFLLILY